MWHDAVAVSPGHVDAAGISGDNLSEHGSFEAQIISTS